MIWGNSMGYGKATRSLPCVTHAMCAGQSRLLSLSIPKLMNLEGETTERANEMSTSGESNQLISRNQMIKWSLQNNELSSSTGELRRPKWTCVQLMLIIMLIIFGKQWKCGLKMNGLNEATFALRELPSHESPCQTTPDRASLQTPQYVGRLLEVRCHRCSPLTADLKWSWVWSDTNERVTAMQAG